MNLLNIYTRTYVFLHIGCKIDFLLSKLRILIRKMANRQLPSFLSHYHHSSGLVVEDIIVSLTSFPARINNVWMVIESLKNQSCLPCKILLWLSKEQFPTEDAIPESLKSRVDKMFEIRMVDGNLKSHKKYYYAFQQYSNKIVITVDDDVFYHPDVIKHLYEDHNKYPKDVIANIASRPIYENEKIAPYKKWKKVNWKYDADNLVQIGIGGVLYPPGLKSSLIFNKELIKDLSPFADDLWLNANLRLMGVKVRKSSFRYFPLGIKNNAPTLSSYNRHNFGNDIQIKKLRDYFMKSIGKDLFANPDSYE